MQLESGIRHLDETEMKSVAGGLLYESGLCDFGGGSMYCDYDPDLYVTSGDFARMDRADYYQLTPYEPLTPTIGIRG